MLQRFLWACVLGFILTVSSEGAAMAQNYKKEATDISSAKARLSEWIAEHDTRSRENLYGIPIAAAESPILEAIKRTTLESESLPRLADAATVFRARNAAPWFLELAQQRHRHGLEYLGRVHALRASAVSHESKQEARLLLHELTLAKEAADALPDLLRTYVALAPEADMSQLSERAEALVSEFDRLGKDDDTFRLRARRIEEFILNDLERANRALKLLDEIGGMPTEARFRNLVSIAIGEDLRFREHLHLLAVARLQDAQSDGLGAEVAEAFRQVADRLSLEKAEEKKVLAAIAAQAAAWFGATIGSELWKTAREISPQEAGFFGTSLMEAD